MLLDLKNPPAEIGSAPAPTLRLEMLEAMVDGAREGLCILPRIGRG